MAMVKDGPDVQLFTHPSALTKLALWLGEAIIEQDQEKKGKLGNGGRGTPLVVGCLNEVRGVYVIVGTGGGGNGLDLGDGESKKAKEEKAKAREERKKTKAAAREAKKLQKSLSRRNKSKSKSKHITSSDSDHDSDNELSTESEGSSSSSESDSESEPESEAEEAKPRGCGRNRFGNAFQEVVAETSARVRIDSFEHCVVEVKKEDLGTFLESLSMKGVVG